MISAFIRSLCPQLAIEIPQQIFAVGTKRVIRDYQLHQGNVAIKDCMFFLPHLWNGEIVGHSDGGHLEIRRTLDDQHVASIRAERNVELFELSRRQFHAVLNLWAHLRGWSVGLCAPAGDSCFADVSQFRETIQACVDQFRIKLSARKISDATKSTFELDVDNPSSGFSMQPNVDLLRKATHRMYLVLGEIVKDVPEFSFDRFNDFCRELEVPADDKNDLCAWFERLRKYWRCVPRFSNDVWNQHIAQIQRQIDILHERLNGNRSPAYELEHSLLSTACRKHTVELLDGDDCNQVQLAALNEAMKALQLMRQDQCASKGLSFASQDSLVSRDLQSRLNEAVDRLIEAHEKAIWKENSQRVFSNNATQKLRKGRPKLAEMIKSSTTEEAWPSVPT